MSRLKDAGLVVPYIGTWIETETWSRTANLDAVVPYIGTWIETNWQNDSDTNFVSYLI